MKAFSIRLQRGRQFFLTLPLAVDDSVRTKPVEFFAVRLGHEMFDDGDIITGRVS